MVKSIFNQIFLYLSIFLLITLEFFCAKLAFETIGEVDSSAYFILVALNTISLALLLLNKQKQLAISFIILIGLIIIPYQLYLGNKLIHLKEEAANITTYLYEQKINSGAYPIDLSGYTFSFPNLQKHFNYSRVSANTFQINYYVGTDTTSHFFRSDTKKWGYYPD